MLPVVLAAMFATSPSVHASESLKGIACRSVHLNYPAPESTAFYNEMTIDQSAEGSYFMVCGFHMGYFGMQELANGKKTIIFSVWEGGKQQNPNATPDEQRVKLLYHDDKVRVGRFGGEGTGGQSFFDYDWKIGHTYRFAVTARIDGDRTVFAGYFFVPEEKAWKHLVTFSTLANGKQLEGYNSFIEDFRRNRVSTTKVRAAHFGNGWIKPLEGPWLPLARAKFTADANPVTNINAAVDGQQFTLATGGETKIGDVALGQFLSLPQAPGRKPPDLSGLRESTPAIQ